MVHYSRAGAIPQLTESTITELDHVSLHPEQSLESDALNTTYILTRIVGRQLCQHHRRRGAFTPGGAMTLILPTNSGVCL